MKRELRWSRRAERDLEAIERHTPETAGRIRQAARLYEAFDRGDP